MMARGGYIESMKSHLVESISALLSFSHSLIHWASRASHSFTSKDRNRKPPTATMLFRSISLLAILASALAAPTSPPTYTTSSANAASAPAYTNAVAPAYASAQDSLTVVKTLHTEVFQWTAAMSSSPDFRFQSVKLLTHTLADATRDNYKICTSDQERAMYQAQLKYQFNSLQTCLKSAQTVIKKQSKHSNDPALVGPVQDCVQEIRYTGEGLIPILGKGETPRTSTVNAVG